MRTVSQYAAVLELLAAGAVIEQASEAPRTFQLKLDRQSVPLPSGLVQQLFAHRCIRATCKVSGRQQYVAA